MAKAAAGGATDGAGPSIDKSDMSGSIVAANEN